MKTTILKLTVCGLLPLFLVVGWMMYCKFLHAGGSTLGAFSRGELGQLGDYFGGILNPTFGFATVLFLLISAYQSRQELVASKKEASRRQLEDFLVRALGDFDNLLNQGVHYEDLPTKKVFGSVAELYRTDLLEREGYCPRLIERLHSGDQLETHEISLIIEALSSTMQAASIYSCEILIKIDEPIIKAYWATKVKHYLTISKTVGALTEAGYKGFTKAIDDTLAK